MAATTKYTSLCKKKDEIEGQIKELLDLLESQKGVGLKEPLTDAEGYPRADIDVYSCRHARHQISCLQNDHVAVMKEIEEELTNIHQQAREQKSQADMLPQSSSVDGPVAMETDRLPFALVDRVDPGSPAAYGGLEVGDELLEFGSVMSENFVNLQTLASVMQHSKGRPLRCVVIRKGRKVNLNVTPNTWSGPGLLGCNIKPTKK
ncbi:26S proteasome non-ATPase regulatory subunit 9-like [Elysia marginata]|uniref:26S proteasome non-ATPase regulatory subunit 9 n=1 Tax=Elysia marginata TaxID=1093978 RepID=A0AAV4IMG0_9GAST|nr:26S proteasome non-ATPase regulatory subunit 9-like [Elysia marginata]